MPQEGLNVFYRFFRDRISWFEADAVCQFHHANLVTGKRELDKQSGAEGDGERRRETERDGEIDSQTEIPMSGQRCNDGHKAKSKSSSFG